MGTMAHYSNVKNGLESGRRWKRGTQIARPLLVAFLFASPAFPQASTPVASPADVAPRRYHLELGSFDNQVSNRFGHWWGSGLSLSYKWSERVTTSGQILAQRRPGETEPLLGMDTLIQWTDWFYTNLALSGGGSNDSAAFFPRVRYDWTANLKVPVPGLILNAGLTKLYFGDPIRGRVIRAGAVYYWRRFVFQGTLYLNNSEPGSRASKAVNGAAQYGQEGRYWLGLIAGGGREAWQTLALTPQDVEFSSYSTSVFLRKWLAPNYGVVASYGYSVKRAAYRIHGLEFKFFLDF